MEIIQDDAKKLVQVWLSRKESGDEALQSRLKPMYAQWKQQKYMVAVFHSGQEDLKENTMALLAYNKRRCGTGGAAGEEAADGKHGALRT